MKTDRVSLLCNSTIVQLIELFTRVLDQDQSGNVNVRRDFTWQLYFHEAFTQRFTRRNSSHRAA
jgi:hypothetical protein